MVVIDMPDTRTLGLPLHGRTRPSTGPNGMLRASPDMILIKNETLTAAVASVYSFLDQPIISTYAAARSLS